MKDHLHRSQIAALLLTSGLALSFAPCLPAQSSKPAPKPLYLPDPTPRQPDLERQYADPPADQAAHDRAAASLNKQRQELLVRASKNLVSLAAALQQALAQPPSSTSLAAEQQVATMMEGLAHNMRQALSPGTGTALAKVPPAPEAPAAPAGMAAQLLTTSHALQAEIGDGGKNTLSLDALKHASAVEELARTLRQQLASPAGTRPIVAP